MARAALTPCRHQGCRILIASPGYCDAHRKEDYRARKQAVTIDYKARNRFYQRALWKRIRAVQLHAEPLCRECRKQGRLVVAEVVDHIVPFADDRDPLAVEQSNLQSLCISCHNAKTSRETWGRVKSPRPNCRLDFGGR